MRARRTALLAGPFAALTLAATVTSSLRLTYHDPRLHAAVETAAAMVALLAAALLLGARRDRALAAALFALALQELLAAAAVTAWVPAAAGLAGALLIAAAAWPPRRGRRWAAAAGALAVAAAAAAGATALSVAAMVAFALAARGFARRRNEPWLLAGTLLAAFAALGSALLGPAGSDALEAGDCLRLAALVALLLAAVARGREAAVAAERTRFAQDLHDDTAQDLAFIVQYCRGLAEGENPPPGLEHVIDAARRALDSSRYAIGTLMRPAGEPLAEALARAAQEVAEREGVSVDVISMPDVEAPAEAHHALSRLVREAVTNAVRHGGAQAVRVEIGDDLLSISDDGSGFDGASAFELAPGHFGLSGMQRRAHSLGGELHIHSQLGRGTEVVVRLR